ncbi:Vacuolar protein sorting/targeting protein 10 [Bienertia sinuspersici]
MASLMKSHAPAHLFSLQSFLISMFVISSLLQLSLCNQIQSNVGEGGKVGRRRLLGFKEKRAGTNTTFECSPSGPCVPCQYSEKNDDKYRCSETGYRIPFKCLKNGGVTKEESGKGPQNSDSTREESVNAETSADKHRTLTDKSSGQKGEPQEYVTYRSCIQGVNEEKISVLGFEVLILGLLLVSGSFIFVKRKRTVAMAGAGNVRVQGNSRF